MKEFSYAVQELRTDKQRVCQTRFPLLALYHEGFARQKGELVQHYNNQN